MGPEREGDTPRCMGTQPPPHLLGSGTDIFYSSTSTASLLTKFRVRDAFNAELVEIGGQLSCLGPSMRVLRTQDGEELLHVHVYRRRHPMHMIFVVMVVSSRALLYAHAHW